MDKQQFKDGSVINGVRVLNTVLGQIEEMAGCSLVEVFSTNLTNVSRKVAMRKTSNHFIENFEAQSRKAKYFITNGILLAKDGNTIAACHKIN